MKIKWLGHAGFELSLDGRTIVVDPFIRQNPCSKLKIDEIAIADIVAVTHSHFDHFGDSVEIARRDKAVFLSTYENEDLALRGGVDDVESLNIGGSCIINGIKVVCTQAFHTGNPCGFVFIGKEGSIYHSGDTGVFGDMALIRELYEPDVALLPIGGRYTMSPFEAAKAAELLRPKVVIPMHYNTFEVIRQKPEEFRDFVNKRLKTRVEIIKEGQTLDLQL